MASAVDTAPLRRSRHAVEEIDEARLERILGTDDDETLVLNQLLEHFRAVAQVASRDANVRPHGVACEALWIVAQRRRKQRLDRRPHAVDDRAQVARLIL